MFHSLKCILNLRGYMAQTSIIIKSSVDEESEGDVSSFSACEDLEDDSELGCCFPGECCMPGQHMRSECYTSDMAEAAYEAVEA